MATSSHAGRTTSRRALALVLTLGVGIGVTACGSDAGSSSAAPATIGADDPAVSGFCTSTDALVSQISALAAAGGDLSTLSAAVDAINTSGKTLVAAKPGAVGAIGTCMQQVSTALATAASGGVPASPTTIAGDTPTDPGTPTTVAGGTSSANPDVQAFCTKADELTAALGKAMADPTSADAAALTAQAQQLATDATTLMTANPSEIQAITECLQRITATLTPGGAPTIPGAAPTTVAATPGGDASGDVEAFCTAAEQLGQQLKDAIANPTGADVAAITAKAQELSAQAQALLTSHPEASARISECISKLNPT